MQCSVVPAGHLHPDTIEEGRAYYTKINTLMVTFSQVSIYLSNVYIFYKIYVVWKEAIHNYLLVKSEKKIQFAF